MEYIESLQKLTVDLGENPNLSQMSAELQKNQIFLQVFGGTFLPEASAITLAERTRICSLKSARSLSNQDLFSKVENTPNCTEITSKPNKARARYMSSVPERLYVLTAELKDRLSDGRINRNTKHLDSVIGRLQESLQSLRLRGTMDGRNYQVFYTRISQDLKAIQGLKGKAVSSSPAAARKVTSTRSAAVVKARAETAAPQATAASSPRSLPQKLPEKKIASAVSNSSVAFANHADQVTTVVATSASRSSEEVKSETSPNCLYAGFVIPQTSERKCQPYKRLPDYFPKDFFNFEQFLCSNDQEIICNPLLFGFVNECGGEKTQKCVAKKPVCVRRSTTATKDCWSLAQQKNTMPQILKIWESPQGEKLYKDFVRSLENLCDPQNLETRQLREVVKADIVKTCDVAFQIFKESLEKKILPAKFKGPVPQKTRSVQSLDN